MVQKSVERTVCWGHWGISLVNEKDICVGGINFPCGPQGPVDGTLGSPERELYKKAVLAWIKDGKIIPPMIWFTQKE